MYIYHALTNTLSAHMIHINFNMILYTHVEHSPTKTVYIKYYTEVMSRLYSHVTRVFVVAFWSIVSNVVSLKIAVTF